MATDLGYAGKIFLSPPPESVVTCNVVYNVLYKTLNEISPDLLEYSLRNIISKRQSYYSIFHTLRTNVGTVRNLNYNIRKIILRNYIILL